MATRLVVAEQKRFAPGASLEESLTVVTSRMNAPRQQWNLLQCNAVRGIFRALLGVGSLL